MARRTRAPRRGPHLRRVAAPLATAALPVVAFLLLLAPQSVTDRARVWAAPLFRPLDDLTAGWALDLSAQPSVPARARPAVPRDLERRLERLQNALAEATARLGDYDRRVRDLARIRASLDGLPCRLVPARVIAPEITAGRTEALLSKGFQSGVGAGGAVFDARLDRGAREAIMRGEPILTAAGLLGIVDEVGPMTSSVRLLTDPETSLMVQLVTRRDGTWRPGPQGVAHGTGDGKTVTVEGVSRTADVVPGDFVVTSASPEAALPAYLVVGRVARCDLEPTSLFYSLAVEPRARPHEAREVYVLSRSSPPER
ncbi:MAG: rod shape-determining protein MreC [Phycisphaerae bacterium]